MKKRILIAAAVLVVAVGILVAAGRTAVREHNTVFTSSLFDGVESAYVTAFADPVCTVKGAELRKLCEDLAAMNFEESDEPVIPQYDEVRYGGNRWMLVLTYKNGDTVSFPFREHLILAEGGQSYAGRDGDRTVSEVILSHFDFNEA